MAYKHTGDEWEIICDRCKMSSFVDCGDIYTNLSELEADLIIAGWDIGDDEHLCSDCSMDG